MIIDFHTHMFPHIIAERTVKKLSECVHKKPDTDGTYEGLLKSSREAGIDCSVVLPIATKPSQFRTINDFASRYLEGEIISFGSVHPASPDYKAELKEIQAMGMKGIKLHPDYQDMYFNDIRYKRIVSYASELDLIVSVHAGVDPKCPHDVHCTPEMAKEMLDQVQPSRLVLAHFGGNKMWDDVEDFLIGRDVYLDTAVVLDTMDEKQFIRMVRNHGADRVLFATDSPWRGQKEFVERMRKIPLTEEEKAQIFSGTAKNLLGI